MFKETIGDQGARSLIFELGVLLNVSAVVIKHADVVANETQADTERVDTTLYSRAIIRHQTKHGEIIHGKRITAKRARASERDDESEGVTGRGARLTVRKNLCHSPESDKEPQG